MDKTQSDKPQTTAERKAAERAATRSDLELENALRNPNTSATARAAAEAELRRRG